MPLYYRTKVCIFLVLYFVVELWTTLYYSCGQIVHIINMTLKDWVFFIKTYKDSMKSPIVGAILNKVVFIKKECQFLYLSCPNNGMMYFLQTKKAEIEKEIKKMFNENVNIVFEVVSQTKNKEQIDFLSQEVVKEETKTQIKQSKKNNMVYDFDSFAVSGSNQLAYSAGLAVVQKPGQTYNPLFIYGGTGVGKTHLSQAIASKLLKKDSSYKVVYCSSEEFTNDLIDSIRSKSVLTFKKKYRKTNVLIVDDIQFIAGKESVQEEFFHTFNAIVSTGGQIILTSDKHPKEIRKLESRLLSRFSGGLIVDIQPPDFELRTAILLIKAKLRNIDLDFDTAKTIAEHTVDTRELEGRLLEYYSKAISTGSPITRGLIIKTINENKNTISKKVKGQSILRIVSVFYDVPVSLIRGSSRKSSVVFPRQVAMYLFRYIKKSTLDEIAFVLKRRDHTTILHGVSKIESLVLKNSQIKEEVDKITQTIYSSS